ncbi:SpoIIAA family protein [Nitrosomonas supralitoralis]|nr:STAS/SEC14 domain-containing protein [Nitrosomonas supralitoralis]
MLTIENAGNLIEIKIKNTLQTDDFMALGEKADKLIDEYGSIRVLMNAEDFNGWENTDAAEKHFSFVKAHHVKVERLAIIAGHMWQHWIAAMARVFMHPEIKVFDKNQLEAARNWLKQ